MLLVLIFLILLIILFFNLQIKLFVKTEYDRINIFLKFYVLNIQVGAINLNKQKDKNSKNKNIADENTKIHNTKNKIVRNKIIKNNKIQNKKIDNIKKENKKIKSKNNKIKNIIMKKIKMNMIKKQFKYNKTKLIKTIYNIVNEANFNIESLKIKINISTTDSILTSYLVMIISNFITFMLKASKFKINYKNCKYSVQPLYTGKKVLKIKLNCIISANLVHIIYIFYKNYKKWRCDINGRATSNRKPYGNSNE